jgi:TPR repeat protein
MKSFCPFLLSMLLLFTSSILKAQELSTGNDFESAKRDYKQFFHSNLREAERGDAKAMGVLGLMYAKGLGCEKDQAEALKWLKKGAQKGDADTENNLGFMYFQGIGVTEDDAEALKWFNKAAAQGLASAEGNLGLMYGRGAGGVHKDYAQSLEWFKKAAEQNDADSQVNLAQMLSVGEGGPKDYVESHKWFSLALKYHSLESSQVSELRNDIEWLEKHMTGKETDEAQKRTEEWKPGGESADNPEK